MDKNEKLIMTVPRTKLFGKKYFQGFLNAKDFDYESIILQNMGWTKRGIAEEDTTIKQPIAYCVLVNPLSREVFIYQRGTDSNYNERKLSGKFSFGFGGHIDRTDDERNPIYNSLLRELGEEVEILGNLTLSTLGYINDDSNDVGKVHFGILYAGEIDTREVRLRGSEASFGTLIKIGDLEKLLKSKDLVLESWSEIALDPVIPLISLRKRELINSILERYCGNPAITDNNQVRDLVRGNIEDVDLVERDARVEDLGFESRIILNYTVSLDGTHKGDYEEIRIFDKLEGPVLSFGTFR